jgi:hypothetical protein
MFIPSEPNRSNQREYRKPVDDQENAGDSDGKSHSRASGVVHRSGWSECDYSGEFNEILGF